MAIFEINRLSELGKLSVPELKSEFKRDLKALEDAVNLLDEASALFAPHERLKSSRHRLVNEIRQKFKLQNSIVT